MTDKPSWTTESEHAAVWPEIEENWARAEALDFSGVDGVPIHAVRVGAQVASSEAGAIVFLPGRTEPLVKYRELTFDLNRRGHVVYLIDHRGQGLSGRLLEDPEKGHVVDFEHYVDDVETLIESHVSTRDPGPIVLFAHSMGGCIAARLLQRRPHRIAASVLFSPMLEIQTGPVPAWLAKTLICALSHMPSALGGDQAYVPGGAGFDESPFEHEGEVNPLTHSRIRFARLMADYADFPAARLGSPTRRWFEEAQDAMAMAVQSAAMIETPTLVFAAGDDPIVGASGQLDFCQGGDAVHGPRVMPGARHELLMEIDTTRSVVLDRALAFVKDALAG